MRTVTLIKGDGIGPEIAESLVRVFEAAKVPIQWEEAVAGLEAIERTGSGVPQDTLDSIKRNGVAIKGPTTTPVGGGHKSVNVTIRKALELYANVRPARTIPGAPSRYDGVDLLVIRENIEDTYGGIEHYQTPNVAQGLKIITRQGSMAVARYAFEQARKLGRRRVTCVHKANIHKITDGLFLESFRQIAAEYTDIEADDVIVDNCCMQLVSRPEQFDVLVLPNLFGDIVSDLCAGLVGGLGVAPGGNIGRECAVFEAVHGSAPDIAGKGLANPTALLLSSVHMLQYLGMFDHADVINDALLKTLNDGQRTRDLGGALSTTEFTEAIIANMHPLRHEDAEIEETVRVTHPVPPVISEEWILNGVDVFVEHAGGLPTVPESVGPFTLSLISNRGTKVWPGGSDNVMLVDGHQCRYMSKSSIGRDDVLQLLQDLTSRKIVWSHVELLHSANGQPRYSKAQGE
jgi:isocitrate dehydrogenase (NAD+)